VKENARFRHASVPHKDCSLEHHPLPICRISDSIVTEYWVKVLLHHFGDVDPSQSWLSTEETKPNTTKANIHQ